MPALGPGTRADQAPAQPALDPRVLAAFRDALAVEVFTSITSGGVAPTATAIGELLGAPRADVVSRLEALERWSLVERLPETADEPTYRSTREALITDEEWAQLDAADRRRVFASILETISAQVWAALENGGFDAPDAHVSRMPVDLDREGYEEMVRLGAETLERARDIQAGVVQRRAEGAAEGTIKSELVFLHFVRPAAPPATDREATDELLERTLTASEDVCDGLSHEEPDWQALSARARELAVLAERLSAAPAPR